MKVLDPGHLYQLDHLDGDEVEVLRFVKRLVPAAPERTETYEGTTCQEVLRALIDRVQHLDREEPHPVNECILLRLRGALMDFEVRAMYRKLARGKLRPELMETSDHDGHWPVPEDF